MSVTLAEGQVGSTHDKIIYPEISTCMTLTAICGGAIVGGHASLFPPDNTLGIDGIIDYILARNQTQTKLLALGELAVWDQNFGFVTSRYADRNAAIAAVSPQQNRVIPGFQPVVRIDTGNLTGGNAAADIEVSLNERTFTIWRRYQNQRTARLHQGFF